MHDRRVIERIVAAIAPNPGQRIIEIGPGTGVLTRELLAAGACVSVIEIDARCWPVLEALSAEFLGRLDIIRGDALAVDWSELLTGGPTPVVGNLPYNVGTEIVARLATLPKPPCEMVFMLQKEVIQRICARPNTKDWGRLGVLCDVFCDRDYLFDVAAGAFTPPPKVVSAVVRLTPLALARFPVKLGALDRMLRLIFGQRRKMLRSVLKGVLSEEQLLALGIEPTWRGEVLDTQKICALAGLIS